MHVGVRSSRVQHRTGIDPALELGLEGSVTDRLRHLHNRGGLPPHHRCDRGPTPGAADADLNGRRVRKVGVSKVCVKGVGGDRAVRDCPVEFRS